MRENIHNKEMLCKKILNFNRKWESRSLDIKHDYNIYKTRTDS